MNKKNKVHRVVFVLAALLGLFLLNFVTSMKSPAEKVSQLISQHRGALVFIRSNTEMDGEFLDALREARGRLRGAAGIVQAGPDSGFIEEGEQLPVLIVYDAHGAVLARFSGQLDESALMDAVNAIAAHAH